jgi:hypothetical protein
MGKSAKPQSDDMFQPGGETRRGVTPGKGYPQIILSAEGAAQNNLTMHNL